LHRKPRPRLSGRLNPALIRRILDAAPPAPLTENHAHDQNRGRQRTREQNLDKNRKIVAQEHCPPKQPAPPSFFKQFPPSLRINLHGHYLSEQSRAQTLSLQKNGLLRRSATATISSQPGMTS